MIKKYFIKFLDKKAAQLEATDPNRILVENISDFFFIPRFLAKLLLEMGVKQGYFSREEDEIEVFYKLKETNQ